MISRVACGGETGVSLLNSGLTGENFRGTFKCRLAFRLRALCWEILITSKQSAKVTVAMSSRETKKVLTPMPAPSSKESPASNLLVSLPGGWMSHS